MPEELWEDTIGPMDLYDSNYRIIINLGNTNDDFVELLDTYCQENNLEWNYSDSVIEDCYMDIAYTADVYGNFTDIIFIDGEVLGRAGFEDGTYTWEDISDYFIDAPTIALPEWFPTEQLEEQGFELRSCEFAAGWYDRHDDPSEIATKAAEQNKHVVFQISYSTPFELGFCLWTKDKD